MKKINSLLLLLFLIGSSAQAMNPIVRTFGSVRAQGMGNVRYTTGLFEENFYANPARITENPEDIFQLPKFTFEAGAGALSSVSSLTKSNSGGGLSQAAGVVGKPITAKFQLVFPAYYNNSFITDEWAFGLGFMFSFETHSQVSQAGSLDPSTMVNAGPVITVARRFMEEDRLAVGLNIHPEFRATVNKQISISDFLAGTNINGNNLGGNGLGLDFDLGAHFNPYWDFLGFQYQIGFAINNILGGYYKNLGRPVKTWTGNPTPSYRSYNGGVSATHDSLWILDKFVVAFELTDISNNRNGSLFRTIHTGAEAVWSVLAFRAGVNQGYFTGGFGLDLGVFELNFATYGEEMSLNAGGLEDRRYSLDLGFKI